jgi:predicted metal-dependent phosphoesterase TrpH
MDGVEVFNSRCLSQKYNINAAAFATKYNLVVTAGSDAHFSNEIGNGGIVTEDENIMEAIAKNQITTFGKRSLLVNHVLTKTLKLIRNDETIISSISVTDIFFDVYLGKWNYRAIPKVKTWSYFLTIP